MDSSVYYLLDKMKRFWLVLRKNPGSMFVCYVIIVLLSYAGISLANLTSHHAYDASMLATTMICDTGPCFEKAVEHHIRRLEDFKDYLDDQCVGGILGFLSGRYNPKKDLDDALATLKKAKDSGSREECAKAIWQAGEQLEQFQMKAASFPRMKIALQQHPKLPDELLLASIDDTVKQSAQALKLFQDIQSLLTGFDLCENNRDSAIQFVQTRKLLISPSKKSQELLKTFRTIVVDTIKAEKAYATNLPKSQKSQKRMFEIFSDSEQTRLKILNAIANEDMEEAYGLQCKAIEKAYHTRQEILELSKILLVEEELEKTVP
jgi:hypothetical protein